MAAFGLLVLLGGGNAVAVHFSSLELPPFWGASLRFAPAALIFWLMLAAKKIPLPRGRALWGAIYFGVISVGIFYAFLYYALVGVGAALSTIVLAMTPLFAFFLAMAHRQETFRWRGLLGSLIALLGIYLTVSGELVSGENLIYLLAIVGAALASAEASVLYKAFPKNDPLVTNAITVTIGMLVLLSLSLISGENWMLPTRPETWAALIYTIPIGTVLAFLLFIYVLDRWTTSATSHAFLLFPISGVLLSSLLTDEVITPIFLLGGALVLFGVWVGVLSGDGD